MKNSRKSIFLSFVAYILIALGLLASLEVSLRLFYAGPLRGVKSTTAFLKEQVWEIPRLFIRNREGVYETNRSPFFITRAQIQHFKVPKEKGTYRIFCIGESSVQGWPYSYPRPESEKEKAFPARLQQLLSKDFKNIEVINAGVGAVSSLALVGLVKELLGYEPDCVILYSGHNEYGYYFWNPEVLKISSLFFQIDSFFNRLYLYRFLLKISQRGMENYDPNNVWHKYDMKVENLSEKYRNFIPRKAWQRFAQNELFLCETVFKNNLLKINSILKSAGVKFIICTVASNLRDFPPFVSFHSSGTSYEDLKKWSELYGRAKSSLDRQKYHDAIDELASLSRLDRGYAETYYLLGKAYYGLSIFDLARKNFILAKDLSSAYPPYQRAPSSLNQLIRVIAQKNAIPLIDIEQEFYGLKDDFGIPGYDMFFDNLHPNEKGHWFIANVLSAEIKKFLAMQPVK